MDEASQIPYLDNPAWHDGRSCRVRDLNVSILDLGLIHSDATYDVIAFRDNQGLALDSHIDRFLASARHWRLPIKYTKQQLIDAVTEIHRRTGWDDSIIWISVTRGCPASGNPRDLLDAQPNVMIYAKPYQKFNGTNIATVCSVDHVVRVPDRSIDQNHKNFVWNDLTMAQWAAIDSGYDTAVLFSIDGYLTEGPGFNVAIVRDGLVLSPKRNRLPGISMRIVEHVCQQNDIDFQWADITRDMVNDCDDMFLTTTVGNIVTVTRYDQREFSISAIQQKLIEEINYQKENYNV